MATKGHLESGGVAVVTIAILVAASYTHEMLSKFRFYKTLYRSYPFYVAESLDKVLSVLLGALHGPLHRSEPNVT
jgi:hypothetical protein